MSNAIQSRRAVVMGASIAGLLAARVLHDFFDEVVLLERDELADRPAPRKGTPQAVHPHGLLARGRQVLEELFPGFTQALVARGALLGDLQQQVGFFASGQRLAGGHAGQPALGASRLAIEHELRARVRALPGVRVMTGVNVLEPILDAASGRVHGVRHAPRDGQGAAQSLQAELTVDCTGRASRSPGWLAQWGFGTVQEERIEIGICYASAYFKRQATPRPGHERDPVAVICASTRELPRPGVLIAQEADAQGTPRWVVGVGGYAGDHPTPTLQGLRERAALLGCRELQCVTQEAEMLGDVIRYTMPYSMRRRYERMARFPAGYLLMGDALTSFNPIYGQGMTVAACEALALRQQLAAGHGDLARRYFRAAAKAIDTPWQLAAGGDLAVDSVPGKRPLPVRLVNAYVARVQRAATLDAAVSLAFLQVVHMLKPPASLFAPGIAWRVLRKGSRRPVGSAEPAASLPVVGVPLQQ